MTADHLCLDSAVVVVSTCTVSTSGPLLSCLDRTCPSSPPKSGPPVFSLAGHVGGTWRRMRAMRLVLLHRASRDSQPYACEACGCFLALYEREIGMELLAGPVGRVVALRSFFLDDLALYAVFYHLVICYYFEGTLDPMPGRRSTRKRTCVLRPVPLQSAPSGPPLSRRSRCTRKRTCDLCRFGPPGQPGLVCSRRRSPTRQRTWGAMVGVGAQRSLSR